MDDKLIDTNIEVYVQRNICARFRIRTGIYRKRARWISIYNRISVVEKTLFASPSRRKIFSSNLERGRCAAHHKFSDRLYRAIATKDSTEDTGKFTFTKFDLVT